MNVVAGANTPPAKQEPADTPRFDLTARFRWLLLAISLPLFVVVLALAVNGHQN